MLKIKGLMSFSVRITLNFYAKNYNIFKNLNKICIIYGVIYIVY